MASPAPRLEVGANGAKSVETDSRLDTAALSVPSVDFILLAPTSSPGQDSNESEETFYTFKTPSKQTFVDSQSAVV